MNRNYHKWRPPPPPPLETFKKPVAGLNFDSGSDEERPRRVIRIPRIQKRQETDLGCPPAAPYHHRALSNSELWQRQQQRPIRQQERPRAAVTNYLDFAEEERPRKVVLRRRRKRKIQEIDLEPEEPKEDLGFDVCSLGKQCYRTIPSHYWENWHPPDHPKEIVLRMSYNEEQLKRAKERDELMGIFDTNESGGVGLSDYELARQIKVYLTKTDRGNDFDRACSSRLKEIASERINLHRKERFNFLMSETDNYLQQMVKDLVKEKSLDEKSGKDLEQWIKTGTQHGDIKQPKNLVGGTLKDYQVIGLNWLASLHRLGLNGILADEMGLGKTIETIALLAYLRETHDIDGPHLVVLPLSTLHGWRDAFATWCPDFEVVVHHGLKDERMHQLEQLLHGEKLFDVVLTTYELMIRDEGLASIPWAYIVVDEAHRLKNKAAKLCECLRSCSSQNRLLLTGTPLQNDLNELWSLLNFILPSLFNNAATFQEWFASPFEEDTSKNRDMKQVEKLAVANRLHKVLRPFLLRRTKAEVLTNELKEKEEIVVRLPMSGPQRRMYRTIQQFRGLFYPDKKRLFSNPVMQLRKCCNHPYMFQRQMYNLDDHMISLSGKFCFLHRLIPKMQRFGHRILIFCQMTHLMDLLGEFFKMREIAFHRLDGKVPKEEREEMINEFNSPDSEVDVFMLSTRAGGLGVNLQTADTVVIFDSDWNPAADLQAQARAHRIGQTKEVKVLRLISEESVEGLVYDRAQEKMKLVHTIIAKGKFDQQTDESQRKSWQKEAMFRLPKAKKIKRCYGMKINELIARSEEELEIFNKMDSQKEEYDWVELDKNDTTPSFLVEPPEPLKDPEPKKKKRKRKNDGVRKKKKKRKTTDEDSNGSKISLKLKLPLLKKKSITTPKKSTIMIHSDDEIEL